MPLVKSPTCAVCGTDVQGARVGYPDVGNVCDPCLVTLGAPPKFGSDKRPIDAPEVYGRLADLTKVQDRSDESAGGLSDVSD